MAKPQSRWRRLRCARRVFHAATDAATDATTDAATDAATVRHAGTRAPHQLAPSVEPAQRAAPHERDSAGGERRAACMASSHWAVVWRAGSSERGGAKASGHPTLSQAGSSDGAMSSGSELLAHAVSHAI